MDLDDPDAAFGRLVEGLRGFRGLRLAGVPHSLQIHAVCFGKLPLATDLIGILESEDLKRHRARVPGQHTLTYPYPYSDKYRANPTCVLTN